MELWPKYKKIIFAQWTIPLLDKLLNWENLLEQLERAS